VLGELAVAEPDPVFENGWVGCGTDRFIAMST
jgi:hypothetical protein